MARPIAITVIVRLTLLLYSKANDDINLMRRLLNPLGFVAFKMGRLRGARKEPI